MNADIQPLHLLAIPLIQGPTTPLNLILRRRPDQKPQVQEKNHQTDQERQKHDQPPAPRPDSQLTLPPAGLILDGQVLGASMTVGYAKEFCFLVDEAFVHGRIADESEGERERVVRIRPSSEMGVL